MTGRFSMRPLEAGQSSDLRGVVGILDADPKDRSGWRFCQL